MDDRGEARALRSLLALYSLIRDQVDGAVYVDDDARIRWVSSEYTNFLGIENREALIGRPVEEVVPQSLMRATVEEGKFIPIDLIRFSNGQFMIVSRVPLRDKHGRVFGAFGFAFKNAAAYIQPLVDRISQLQMRLDRTEKALATPRRTKYTFDDFAGVSPAVNEVRRLAYRAAAIPLPVLLLGETGTGKELLAQAIHSASNRHNRPFIALNVAAIPEELAEAEFFGVTPGAYTGAGREPRPGKFQLADRGTLFLDEVGDISLKMQSKLLRVLEEHEIEPVGSNRLLKVDVRVVAATNRDLAAMVREGRFRDDLYYRLNVLPIRIPPLRERKEDIRCLATSLVAKAARSLKVPPFQLTEAAFCVLERHDWPGNVRELANVIEQAYVRAERLPLDAVDFERVLPLSIKSSGLPAISRSDTLGAAARNLEVEAIGRALRQSHGNKAETARTLGISRSTLYQKMTRYGLSA